MPGSPSTGSIGARLPDLLPAGLALLAGLDAALALLRGPAPITNAGLPQVHGHLMVLGVATLVVTAPRRDPS